MSAIRMECDNSITVLIDPWTNEDKQNIIKGVFLTRSYKHPSGVLPQEHIFISNDERWFYWLGYYKDFQLNENEAIAVGGGDDVSIIPTVEPAVIQAFPTGPRWSDENKQEMVKFLKGKFMAIKEESIARQVDNFANGLTNTIVLYDNTADGNLFSLNSVRGTRITSINTEHPFYKKVIEKLKENRALGVFTIAIEMIICSFAYEMDSLIRDEEKLELILNRYLRLTSDRLSKFITEGNIEVDTSYWENNLNEDSDF